MYHLGKWTEFRCRVCPQELPTLILFHGGEILVFLSKLNKNFFYHFNTHLA